MKKYAIIIFFSILLSSCGASRLADVNSLRVGMTPDEVTSIMGNPVRILSTNSYSDGVESVYEYVNYRNEAYAVEFWNNRLSGYKFMYEFIEPVPPIGVVPVYPMYPPVYPVQPPPARPPSGRPPVAPPVRPGKSGRPTNNSPSNVRPTPKPNPGSTGNTKPSDKRPTPEKDSNQSNGSDNTTIKRPTTNDGGSDSKPSVSGGRSGTASSSTSDNNEPVRTSGRGR